MLMLTNAIVGDQFVGRTAAGLPMTAKEFAILSPHFATTINPPVSPEEYDDILPGYKKFPPCFVSVIPFLLASIVFHRDGLRRLLTHSTLFLQQDYGQVAFYKN